MPRSQCWCVDGVSKFAFRVLPDTYYRIELPGETPEDLEKVEELKLVLAKVLFYERSSCPFARGFHVEVNEDEALKQPKGLGRQKSQGRAKRWTLQGEYSWKPEDWEERQRMRAERERERQREAQERQQALESDESSEGEETQEGARGEESQEGAQTEEAEAKEEVDDVPDLQTPSFIAAWRSLTSPAQLNSHSSPTPGRIRIPKGFDEDGEGDGPPEVLGGVDQGRVRTWQNVPTSMPPSPPDSSAGAESGDTAGVAEPRRQDINGGSEQDSSSDETVEAEKETASLLDVPQRDAPSIAQPSTSDPELSRPPTFENERLDDQSNAIPEEAVTEIQTNSTPNTDAAPPEPTSRSEDPFAAIQARILARRSIGGNASLRPSPRLSSSPTSSNASTTSRRSTFDTSTSTTTTRYNGGKQQAFTSALVKKAATVFLGPPVELAVIMLRIAARISGRAFGSSFIIASPAGSKHVPGSFNLGSIDADELDDEAGSVGEWAEDDFGVPLQSPVRLAHEQSHGSRSRERKGGDDEGVH
ncbi:hypothetical protein D0865_04868 [Hortaea werneckii]|uniref:Inheritance of peroxisomes protein 1 n=1 Tax=Hortaea werneckii TaxID=91943 RepID=A0A3M7CR88_HORWE|nr:hypothetical protein D0865_04868 [Hortaea werneckii]